MSKSKHFNGQLEGADKMAVDKMAVEAYSPPDERQRSDHIVDVVCRIMDDDGPQPMRDCRPTQKSRNAADQFDADHQAAYEARAQQSRDRMQAVRLHNTAYPKMHDELNRKRSTAKITMTNAQRTSAMRQAAYNRCNTCFKNKKRAEPKKNIFTSRHTKDMKRSRQRQAGTRVTKLKSRQRSRRSPCQIYRLSKIRTNRGCQCSTYILAKDKKSGTNDILLNLEPQPQKTAEDTFVGRDLKGTYSDAFKNQSKTSQYSKESSKRHNHNPDSDPSVSSYNSYASLEDEPMVSN